MTGDPTDMARRMRAVMPFGWFSDDSSVLQGLLEGIGTAWSAVYALIEFVGQQTRVLTATGTFLDEIAGDFFGSQLLRRTTEVDAEFLTRIEDELLRERGTRAALIVGLQQLTGNAPAIFEPARTTDTGGYAIGGVGYGLGGGWGNLDLPFQFFITAYRPRGGGISELSGYGTGGVPVYASLSMVQAPVQDADIFVSISKIVPVAVVAWARIM